MTKRNRLTIEQKLELAAEHKKGVSPKVLSERYGVSLRQVDAIVQRERAGTFAKLSPSKHYTFRAPEGDVEAYLDLAASLGIAHAHSEGDHRAQNGGCGALTYDPALSRNRPPRASPQHWSVD